MYIAIIIWLWLSCYTLAITSHATLNDIDSAYEVSFSVHVTLFICAPILSIPAVFLGLYKRFF